MNFEQIALKKMGSCYLYSPEILLTYKMTKILIQTDPRDELSFTLKVAVSLAQVGFSGIIW